MIVKQLTVLNGCEPTIFSIDYPYIGKIEREDQIFHIYNKKMRLTDTVMNCSVIIEWGE